MAIKIIFAVILFFTTVASANSETSIEILSKKAKTGDPNAQLAYAQTLYPTARAEAFIWAKKAGNQGLAQAWYWLGENSTDQSIEYYEKAALLGYPQAFSVIVDHYLMGGENANFAKAKTFADLAKQKKISIGLNADDENEKIQTINYCLQAGPVKIPLADLPTLQQIAQFKSITDCDPYRLGIDAPKNFSQYRICLLAQKEIDNISLAEIYANGWGVKRNPNLALALICHAQGVAPAELYGTVNNLFTTRHLSQLSTPFDFCDHITSGANMSVCAARDQKVAVAKRNAVLTLLMKSWPKPDRQAFKNLKQAADAFFEEHATSELDMSGTARGMIAINEKSQLQEEFLKDIQNFEQGKWLTDTNIKQADGALNVVYRKIMAADFSNDQKGTLSANGFKITQQKWLKYRDAWAAFGTLHYKQIKSEAWLTWITKRRSAQLNKILNDF